MNEEKKIQEPTVKLCVAFEMDNAEEAWDHLSFEIVEEYGDTKYGHDLYTWDRGDRTLLRCRTCGGFVLRQSSVYESFDDGEDDHYDDYFPVSGPEEADALNRKYDGFSIERQYPGHWLMRTNGTLSWSGTNKQTEEDMS